jgi:hypothetical protein
MKIFYLIVFISFSFFAGAQNTSKLNDSPTSEVEIKVQKFYPNPATSIINFEFAKDLEKGYTLQIFNFIGKKVFEVNNISQKNIIPLSDFYRGVYIFQLRDKSGRVLESGKFQVVK